MELEFVAVTPATLETALELMNRLYTGAGGSHDRPRARRAAEWLFSHPDDGCAWLMEVEGEIAGYLVVTACFSLEFGGWFGLLDELYFDERWRGQGLGARAIAFGEDWCRAHGMDALRLEVAHNNEQALRLYQRMGFVTHHRDLMTKWL
jgi:ribosomal protein S18 acetylase RimI-like enzyme